MGAAATQVRPPSEERQTSSEEPESGLLMAKSCRGLVGLMPMWSSASLPIRLLMSTLFAGFTLAPPHWAKDCSVVKLEETMIAVRKLTMPKRLLIFMLKFTLHTMR